MEFHHQQTMGDGVLESYGSLPAYQLSNKKFLVIREYASMGYKGYVTGLG